jgi:rhamnulokinase
MKAVALDFGAGSARIAVGELADNRISFRIVRQIAHEARLVDGLLRWEFKALLEFCKEAVNLAESEHASSLGIDSWGVDHGFLDRDGALIADPVCYRDLSHVNAFESLAPYRRKLYELTGTQHQPFNTICQLVARRLERPTLVTEASDWMILPDLLGYMLGGGRCSELTQASTTQLLGCDDTWSSEAFEIAGWPMPQRTLTMPGAVVGQVGPGISLVTVGSHDTASAVAGFGKLSPTDVFLNIGTWSLCGLIVDRCLTSSQVERFGFTNERTVDGKVRLLKNIPGFYFINRLHSELGVECTVPQWLETAGTAEETLDLFDAEFFNPSSMVETCVQRLSRSPSSHAMWAAVALESLAEAVLTTCSQLAEVTGHKATSLHVGGGGSQSQALCFRLANRLKLPVVVGAPESTVLGNLAAQFLGQGAIETWEKAFDIVNQSFKSTTYLPAETSVASTPHKLPPTPTEA